MHTICLVCWACQLSSHSVWHNTSVIPKLSQGLQKLLPPRQHWKTSDKMCGRSSSLGLHFLGLVCTQATGQGTILQQLKTCTSVFLPCWAFRCLEFHWWVQTSVASLVSIIPGRHSIDCRTLHGLLYMALLSHFLYCLFIIGDTTEELCSRWMELGAFYPFSRNHNTKGAMPQVSMTISFVVLRVQLTLLQEPYRWSSVANISKKVLGIRYSLLPYYYTLFYKAHRSVDSSNPPAATVVRPLFFEFPKDPKTYTIDKQFLVGNGILISPQLNIGKLNNSPCAGYFTD